MSKKVPETSDDLMHSRESSPALDLQISREIDDYLKTEKKKFDIVRREPKLLILGTSDSGKSTLLKQMKILHGGGIPKEEIDFARAAIRKTIVDTCRVVLSWRSAENQPIPEEFLSLLPTNGTAESEKSAISISSLAAMTEKDIVITLPLAQRMFDNPELKKSFLALQETLFPVSSLYFLENIGRIMAQDYTPTNEDVLLLRTVTSNISETIFTIKQTIFHFYDVSGLKHHRKYWIPYFDKVTSILFIVDLSSYDQMMLEDVHTNRMQDTLTVFDFIANHPLLKHPSIIVLFNKMDRFRMKAKEIEIKKYFPDYDGRPLSISNGYEYFRDRFKKIVKGDKVIEIHPSCATDTDTMRVLISSMVKGIIEKNMNSIGLYP